MPTDPLQGEVASKDLAGGCVNPEEANVEPAENDFSGADQNCAVNFREHIESLQTQHTSAPFHHDHRHVETGMEAAYQWIPAWHISRLEEPQGRSDFGSGCKYHF